MVGHASIMDEIVSKECVSESNEMYLK